MNKRLRTRGNYPEWMEVYENFAKKGIRIIPVNYNDLEILGPNSFELLAPKEDATTDINKIKEWATLGSYWAIQIGSYCNILVIRFDNLQKHDDYVNKYGEFIKTVIIESPVHKDYLFKFSPMDDPFLNEVTSTYFELLFKDEFVIVPPSLKYQWSKKGIKNLKNIPTCPGILFDPSRL